MLNFQSLFRLLIKKQVGVLQQKAEEMELTQRDLVEEYEEHVINLKEEVQTLSLYFSYFLQHFCISFLSYCEQTKLSFMVKWFVCFNNWVATWRLGAWGHPRASTTDSQLLDVDHSHGWHSLATLPSAPTEEGRKAGTHHSDKSGGKGWLEMWVYGKTNPMHKKCQCLNWFLNPLKDALHTLYTWQTTRHMTCDPGGCYIMLLLIWMAADPLLTNC